MRTLVRSLLAVLSLVAAPAFAATITVNSTSDELNSNGNCSLREAIGAANSDSAVDGCSAGSGADVIVLPAGVYTLTLVGGNEDADATGDLDVLAPLTIQGDAAATTVIDGNGSDRVLQVIGSSVAVQLAHLTIRNGRPPVPSVDGATGGNGGAINNAGLLTLDDVTFLDNSGGAGAPSTKVEGGFGGDGGAIFSNGSLGASDCRFLGNQSGDGGAGTKSAFGGFGAHGGAVAVKSDSSFTRCAFSGNSTGVGGSGSQTTLPGEGGAIWQELGVTTVKDCSFSDNSASGNFGGAIAFHATLVVSGSTFSGNVAQLGGAILADSAVAGASPAVSTITSSTFVGNQSTVAGAICNGSSTATLEIYGSDVVGNQGGGLSARGGIINLRNTIVLGNRSVDDSSSFDCETVSGSLTSQGYNVVEDGGCGGGQLGDQLIPAASVASTVVGTLASLGGATQVLPLPPGSVALGGGTCSDGSGAIVAVDQRGAARTVPCDVGAVQMSAPLGAQLVDVTAEPPGAHCAAGGERIDVGLDSNDDGVLETGEITSTSYVCNGVAGVDGGIGAPGGPGAPGAVGAGGLTSLTALTPLGSGDAHCAAGGSRVDVGVDTNGDGKLESGEIQSTAYVCDGSAGHGGCQLAPKKGNGSPAPLMLLLVALALIVRRRATM